MASVFCLYWRRWFSFFIWELSIWISSNGVLAKWRKGTFHTDFASMILVGVQGRSHMGTRPMVLTPSADQMGCLPTWLLFSRVNWPSWSPTVSSSNFLIHFFSLQLYLHCPFYGFAFHIHQLNSCQFHGCIVFFLARWLLSQGPWRAESFSAFLAQLAGCSG